MQTKIWILFFMLLFSPVGAMAGSGHDHGHGHSHGHEAVEVTKTQAEQIASDRVAMYVDQGKIDASWKSVAPSSAETKVYNGHPEWVVTFNNGSVSDPAKQTLYVFLTLTGDHVAANYTGN